MKLNIDVCPELKILVWQEFNCVLKIYLTIVDQFDHDLVFKRHPELELRSQLKFDYSLSLLLSSNSRSSLNAKSNSNWDLIFCSVWRSGISSYCFKIRFFADKNLHVFFSFLKQSFDGHLTMINGVVQISSGSFIVYTIALFNIR